MKGTIGEGILEWKLLVRSERLGKMRGTWVHGSATEELFPAKNTAEVWFT